MKITKNIGLVLFVLALTGFVLSLSLSRHILTETLIRQQISNEYHRQAILDAASAMLGKAYPHNVAFVNALRPAVKDAQISLDRRIGIDPSQGQWTATDLPEGVTEGEYRIYEGNRNDYVFALTKYSAQGLLPGNTWLFFLLTIVLGAVGTLVYLLPDLGLLPGIKNNHVYHSSATRGVNFTTRMIFLGAVLLATIMVGVLNYILPAVLTIVAAVFIIYRVYRTERRKNIDPAEARTVSPPRGLGLIGLTTGIFLIAFYVALYFFPEYITNWTLMLDPVSTTLSGNPAGRWFLYGFLYTLVMLVMGIRMLIKYRHNRYQLIRTGSVMFFQTAFAFLIPEIMVRLNQPYMDLKDAWPLNYDFFFGYNIDGLVNEGTQFAIAGWSTSIGTLMFIWGILLTLVVVPLFTYFYGKRWYCSWVCGCGGLAETLGDPYRQLSDKSLTAWKFERWIIHGVLVFAVVMTGMVLYTYWTGNSTILGFDSFTVRSWYGFFVGSIFAGVVGTGFYPIMGNRVWCRFGCPLAAILGLVQRFKSRFRITTNGGQCISCGNCSTYCEMGIDVRFYAQRGQDVVRASCVGCGICAAVCPRGVLRLENGSVDISNRTTQLRALHITEEGVRL